MKKLLMFNCLKIHLLWKVLSQKNLYFFYTHEQLHRYSNIMSKLLLCANVLIYMVIFFSSSNARCCKRKIVGDEIYTFVARRDQVYENCRNGCTYRKNGSDSLFCFASGKKVSECQEGRYWWSLRLLWGLNFDKNCTMYNAQL